VTDWLELAGKTALVVGAGGFGTAIVRAFAGAGAVTLAVDSDEDRLRKIRAEFGASIRTAIYDVSTKDRCEAAVADAAGELGGLDLLVHAVGVNRRVAVDDITQTDWDTIMQVNAASCLWLGRCAAAIMRGNGGGRMVFISSVSGSLVHPDHGAYAASKGALNQLVRAMATEWAGQGIGVNAVAPGYALTSLTEAYCSAPGRIEELLARIPAGRLAMPEDVADATMFLSSARASYITGQVVYVDGGRTLD
jgi:gluconate 5-dehydrogenase